MITLSRPCTFRVSIIHHSKIFQGQHLLIFSANYLPSKHVPAQGTLLDVHYLDHEAMANPHVALHHISCQQLPRPALTGIVPASRSDGLDPAVGFQDVISCSSRLPVSNFLINLPLRYHHMALLSGFSHQDQAPRENSSSEYAHCACFHTDRNLGVVPPCWQE